MEVTKQNILKFFLLAFLTVKVSFYVFETFSLAPDIDKLVQVDFDEQSENESEKENSEKKDVDEKELLAVVSNYSNELIFKNTIVVAVDANKTYQTQYLEFSTPPPEFLV